MLQIFHTKNQYTKPDSGLGQVAMCFEQMRSSRGSGGYTCNFIDPTGKFSLPATAFGSVVSKSSTAPMIEPC